MKSKIQRMQTILELLSSEDECSAVKLCEDAEISGITLKRYLVELRRNGYIIKSSSGSLKMHKEGLPPSETEFTSGSYTGFRVLMYIYNNNPCNRSRLKACFCKGKDYGGACITDRMLDEYLKKLLELELVHKERRDREVFFSISEDIIAYKSFDFDKTLRLINYLKIYRDTLPFRDMTGNITEKLEIACINHLRSSIEATENVMFTYVVFPDCVMEQCPENKEKLVERLEEFCLSGRPVKIKMKQGSKLRVYPFLMVFSWELGCWYLVCRHVKDDNGGFDLVRLDRVEDFEEAKGKVLEQEEVIREAADARRELQKSFAISFEQDTPVEVIFVEPDQEELDEILHRMRKVNYTRKQLNNENIYYFQVSIRGTYDFLSWLRKFGSKAIILNEQVGKLHLENAKTALEKYDCADYA